MRFGVFVADYETTLERACLGLMAGAAADLGALFLIAELSRDYATLGPTGFWSVLGFSALIYLVALIGVGALGGPLWAVLHRLRLRGWGAALLGGMAPPVLLWLRHSGVPRIAFEGFEGGLFASALIIGACGGLTGLTAWAVAYRRPAPPPSADTAE